MSTTIAKIAGRAKTENTGITPELANKMHKNVGSRHMAIVELRVAEESSGDDNSKGVKLEIDIVEPAPDKETEDHLRDLQRAAYFRRNPQQTLTEKDPFELNVVDVLDKSGQTVLNCAHCDHKYYETRIAHTRGEGEDYPPCVWISCGHVVKRDETKTCTKSHRPVEAAKDKAKDAELVGADA